MNYRSFVDLMVRDLEALIGAPAPVVFQAEHPLPLKVNVHLDLIERFPGVNRDKLGRWLILLTQRGNYLQAVARGGPRYDLDGVPSGEVSEHERQHSAAAYKRASTPKPPKTVGKNGRAILKLKPKAQRQAVHQAEAAAP